MIEAKKLYENQPEMKIPKDEKYTHRLEQRYSLDYKSVASSSIHQANTSQLESLVKTIENEDLSQDTVVDKILYYANSMLNQIGYTNSVIQSRSKRKLKKAQSSLNQQIFSTDEQLVYFNSTISQIDNYLTKSFLDLKIYQDTLSEKTKKLTEFKKEIIDYTAVTKKSLDPAVTMRLEQAELDYQIEEHLISDLQETCDVSFSMIQEYYSQKSQDISMRSIFEGNKIILESLQNKISLELERANNPDPIKVLSQNRSKITSVYKVQDDLLNKVTRFTSLYNQKIDSLPSFKEMSDNITKKRRSLPLAKR